MHVGLFFGSFNPVHIGHMAIANYLAEFGKTEQIWFVVSPLNPFKKKASLLPEYQRLELVNRAIGDDLRFRASNIEFALPQPSYTIDTIIYLKETYPDYHFSIIMGSDQLAGFHKWKNPEQLQKLVDFIVYPRPDTKQHELLNSPHFELIEAPLMDISSSFIRQSIQNKHDVRHFLHKNVWEYIQEMNFYT